MHIDLTRSRTRLAAAVLTLALSSAVCQAQDLSYMTFDFGDQGFPCGGFDAPRTYEWDPALDGQTNAASGSLKVTVAFAPGADTTSLQTCVSIADLTKYATMRMDLYLDPTNAPNANGNYGSFLVRFRPGWAWPGVVLDFGVITNTGWTHLERPMPPDASQASGINFTWSGFEDQRTLWIDNIIFTERVITQTEWTGASGTDLFWATPANWSGLAMPMAVDFVRFMDAGVAGDAATDSFEVASSATAQSLHFGHTSGFHNGTIQPGVKLRLEGDFSANTLLVGTETDNGAAQTVEVNIGGDQGELELENPTGRLIVRQGSSTSGSQRATLNLTNLNRFTANLGRVLIGSEGPAVPRQTGTLQLARTNRLTIRGSAPALAIGGLSGGNGNAGGSSFLFLGQDNAIFASSITVGRGKQFGENSIRFNPSVLPDAIALFRGVEETNRMASWIIADGDTSGGTTTTRGFCNFSGGRLDALVDTMVIGKSSTGGSTAGIPEGYFTFDQGTLNVNNLRLGVQNASGPLGAKGIMNVQGTAELVITAELELARALGGTGAANVAGTLNIVGGNVTVGGRIIRGTGVSAINITNGSLTLAPGSQVAASVLQLNSGTESSLVLGGTVSLQVNKSAGTNDLVLGLANLVYGGSLVVTNLGGTLQVGDTFTVFQAANPSGNFTGITSSPAGVTWSFNPATGGLTVVSLGSPTLNYSQSGNTLTLSWARAGFKLQSQTNALNVGLSNNWFDYPGGASGNVIPVNVTIEPASPGVFFRLISQ